MTVRDAVLQLLRSFGMQRIFGNPGSTELPLFLDFPSDFEYVDDGQWLGHRQAAGAFR